MEEEKDYFVDGSKVHLMEIGDWLLNGHELKSRILVPEKLKKHVKILPYNGDRMGYNTVIDTRKVGYFIWIKEEWYHDDGPDGRYCNLEIVECRNSDIHEIFNFCFPRKRLDDVQSKLNLEIFQNIVQIIDRRIASGDLVEISYS